MSERLSLATTEMLRRTTGSIDSWIAGGFSVDQMASQLESHFAGKTSLFGSVRGGMELRRIARSEPLFAFSQAAIAAAATNPYVGVVYIERGRSEPCPICDFVANASPYTLEDVPPLGLHAHCMCKYRFDVLDEARWDTDDTQWRQMMGALSPRFEEVLLRQSRNRGE